MSRNRTTDSRMPSPAPLMGRVAERIEARNLSGRAAAIEIGVTLATLERHVAGEHVRSDSARKYEDWLSGRGARRKVFRISEPPQATSQSHKNAFVPDPMVTAPPSRPHLVVDIFSGCGGLSLGFDLFDGGRQFRTVMALDIQPATIAIMNRNHAALPNGSGNVARVVDLTEFLDETEIVAFYMEHVVRLHDDAATRQRLSDLAGGMFPRFLKQLRTIDERFLNELGAARQTSAYRQAYDALDKGVLGQTSVIGFQDALKLPRASRSRPTLPQVLWADIAQESGAGLKRVPQVPQHLIEEARSLWDGELRRLELKEEASGTGQLSSSARRIKAFTAFARSLAFIPVREAWSRWQAARMALRAETFSNEEFARSLRKIYEETYPVAVLLGGPPCQGFSRIGRGKIRSLREAHIHVHGDEEVGDTRNLLYQRYLLVVSALRPVAFKFENVQHFQSIVRSGGGEFLATEILADAIAAMSGDEASYAVSSRTIDASSHGIPQTRQRFFMSGLRRDAFADMNVEALAARCLTLPSENAVPLSVALDGLPEAIIVGGGSPAGDAMSRLALVTDTAAVCPASAAERLRSWLRQPIPGRNGSPTETNAHVARATREDDAQLFGMFGPGKRWMDYRVDEAPTLSAIHDALRALSRLPANVAENANRRLAPGAATLPSPTEASELLACLDGSLALRLLMEQIGVALDAPHHLVTPNYLAKRDGHHGDWLARLDGSRPCKTLVAHMGKDTYGYIHPQISRTISVREAARVQTFPDWYSFGAVALTDALKMIGNAVPPLLSRHIAARVAEVLALRRLPVPAVHLTAAA